jgi:hypothetical protein
VSTAHASAQQLGENWRTEQREQVSYAIYSIVLVEQTRYILKLREKLFKQNSTMPQRAGIGAPRKRVI